KRGGVARQLNRSWRSGVVSSAKSRACRSSIEASPYRARASCHPVCAASVASRYFFMAQPPLLCEEGNVTVVYPNDYSSASIRDFIYSADSDVLFIGDPRTTIEPGPRMFDRMAQVIRETGGGWVYA